MFKISKQQLAGLRAGMLEQSRRRVLAYLRETAPDLTCERDNASLYALVLDYEASGRAVGLRSEQAHAKWAYLMLTTGGEFDAPPVRAALADPEQGSADLALDLIMAAMVELESSDPASVG
jgi:hypothetical protein